MWVKAPLIHFLSCGWVLAIFLLSAAPGRELPDMQIAHLDKIAHMIAYVVGAVLLCFSLRAIERGSLIAVIILLTGYGYLLEWMQGTFFEGRYFDLLDGLANAVGAVVGIVIFKRIDRTF